MVRIMQITNSSENKKLIINKINDKIKLVNNDITMIKLIHMKAKSILIMMLIIVGIIFYPL